MFARREDRVSNVSRLMRLLFPSATLKIYGKCSLPEEIAIFLANVARTLGNVTMIENFRDNDNDLCLHVVCGKASGVIWVTPSESGRYLFHSFVNTHGVGVPPDIYLPVPSPRGVLSCTRDVRRLLSGMETELLARSLAALEELSAAPHSIDIGRVVLLPFITVQKTEIQPDIGNTTSEIARLLRQVGVKDMALFTSTSKGHRLVKKAVQVLTKVGLRGGPEGIAFLSCSATPALLIIYPRLGLAAKFILTDNSFQKRLLMAPRLFEVYPETNRVTIPVTGSTKMHILFRDEKDIEKLRSLLADLLDIVTAETFKEKAMRRLGRR